MGGQFAAFVGISLLVIIAPGPDMALVTRNALLGGQRNGVFTSFGVVTGLTTWTIATSAGIAALLIASEPAFLAVKLLGAAYLILLGAQSLRSALRSHGPESTVTAGEARRRVSALVPTVRGLSATSAIRRSPSSSPACYPNSPVEITHRSRRCSLLA